MVTQMVAFGLGCSIALGACTATTVQEKVETPPKGIYGEVLTVLPQGPQDHRFAECVSDTLKTARPNLQFVPQDQFRDALFPWFEPGIAPKSAEELASLLGKRLVEEMIAKLGIRYVILVTGETVQQGFEGPFGILSAPPAGGFFGYATAPRETKIAATIWDLKGTRLFPTEHAEARGAFVAAAFILPVLIPTATETPACKDLGQRLAGYFGYPD